MDHKRVNINYAAPPSPDGRALTSIIDMEFVGDSPSALILGDNIYYGNDLRWYNDECD